MSGYNGLSGFLRICSVICRLYVYKLILSILAFQSIYEAQNEPAENERVEIKFREISKEGYLLRRNLCNPQRRTESAILSCR